jgi:uncharacterized protein YlxW (UPF0749 family)
MASFRPGTIQHLGRSLGRIFTHPQVARVPAEPRQENARAGMLGTIWLSVALLLGGVALGIAISTDWQAQAEVTGSASSPITRQTGRELVEGTIRRLEAEQADLKKQIADLRTQLGTAQSTASQRKSTLSDLTAELDHQQVAAGVVPLHGAGVVAVFNDSTDHDIAPNEDPANYILHDYDLRDMLNALWTAGAEAVSLNGERVVNNTSLYCVGTTILINSTRLSPPYEVHAIGDPAALQAALLGSPQMEKFNQRARIYDLPGKIDRQQDVTVPAYNGSFVFKYATVEK